MDSIDKKILKYLSERQWISNRPLINNTFQGFGLSKEDYVKKLDSLKEKDFVRIDRPIGHDDQSFVCITEKGRTVLKSFYSRIMNYIGIHILEILTLLVTIISLILILT